MKAVYKGNESILRRESCIKTGVETFAYSVTAVEVSVVYPETRCRLPE